MNNKYTGKTLIVLTLALFLTGLVIQILSPPQTANALQITSRSLGLSTSKSQATATWTYTFTLATAGNVGALKFEACTTALGTCTSPGGTLNMNVGTMTNTSGWAGTAFTLGAGAGSCTATSNITCGTRTAAAETATAHVLTISSQVNPTALATFFVRITTFSDAGYTTAVDTGVVAAAIVNQLTLNTRIQEVLSFCVGTTTVNDSTTTPGADCAAITGNTVDMGILDPATVVISPVAASGGNGASGTNGIAMVRSNASTGTVVSYFAELNSSSGSFKVTSASCGSTVAVSGSISDQCMNSYTTQTALAVGTEAFGMTIAAVNCVSTTSYTCVFTSGTYNLVRDTNYDGTGANSYGTSGGFAWQTNGSVTTLATSAGSTVKAVDDEALILRFAAVPANTTPQGSYTVVSTYIATSTY